MSLNRAIIIGRLTREPESQYTASGIAIAKFTVAVDRISKNPETGEKETDFIPCVAFRRTAEYITQYVTKGQRVGVEGRIQVRSWVDQGGQRRYMTEIVVDNVQALDKPREGDAGGYAPEEAGYDTSSEPAGAGARRGAVPSGPPASVADDSDPFADE